jgi:PadR family transcriptional regulator, regulatory protein PadR
MAGQKDQRELLPGTLEMLILKTLNGGPQHGYGIAQHIQQTSDDVLQVEEGSLYPALQRLEVKGWVAAEWGLSPTGRRARNYKLTTAGRKQLGIETSNYERLIAGIARVMGTA